MSVDRVINIDGREIELYNLDKTFFPEDGLTKGDLVDYYQKIAAIALPYCRNRPLSMQRFPDGIDAEGFFQKNIGDYFPDWIDRVELSKENGTVIHVVANNRATLAYLANQGMITAHVGLSRIDRIHNPDRMIFDLDPSSEGDFENVQWAAEVMRALLHELGLDSAVMTTGSRGLHVLVPLDRKADFDAVGAFARKVAEVLAGQYADKLTVEQRKDKRGKRIFLDTLRNAYGQTAVVPYTVRALPGAPVATPLEWDEALGAGLGPRDYTIKTVFRRLGQKKDPWDGLAKRGQSLANAQKKLANI